MQPRSSNPGGGRLACETGRAARGQWPARPLAQHVEEELNSYCFMRVFERRRKNGRTGRSNLKANIQWRTCVDSDLRRTTTGSLRTRTYLTLTSTHLLIQSRNTFLQLTTLLIGGRGLCSFSESDVRRIEVVQSFSAVAQLFMSVCAT
jgi:hypothetical protein